MMSKIQKIKLYFSSSKLYRRRFHYWLLKLISVIISYFIADFIKNKLVISSEEGKTFGWIDVIRHHPDKWVPALAIGAGLLSFLFFGSLISWLNNWLTFSFHQNQLLEIIKKKKINLFGEEFSAEVEEIAFSSYGSRPIIQAKGILNLQSTTTSNLKIDFNSPLHFRATLPASFLTNLSLTNDLANSFPSANVKIKEKEFFLPSYYLPFLFITKVVFWSIIGVYIYSLNNHLDSKNKSLKDYLSEQSQKVDVKKYQEKLKKEAEEAKKQEEEKKIMFRPAFPDEIKENISDFGGYEEQKKVLQRLVRALKKKRPVSRGVLLWGPPGTGKTMLAKVVAKQFDLPYFWASGINFKPSLEDEQKGVRNNCQKIEEFFKTASAFAAKHNYPGIICLIDEFNEAAGVIAASTNFSGDRYSGSVGRDLLPALDSLANYPNVLLIATANWPGMFDDAVLRTGRLDEKIAIPVPSKEELKQITTLHLKKFAKENPQEVNNCNPEEFAGRFAELITEKWWGGDRTGADIDGLIFRKLANIKADMIEEGKVGDASVMKKYGFTEEIFNYALKQLDDNRYSRVKERIMQDEINKEKEKELREYYRRKQEEREQEERDKR